MKRQYLKVLITCTALIYLENELSCRNLCFWFNNDSGTFLQNLFRFLYPYIFPLLAILLLIRDKKYASYILVGIGFIKLFMNSLNFVKHELWQYEYHADFSDYLSSIDTHELTFIFYFIIRVTISIILIKYFMKTNN